MKIKALREICLENEFAVLNGFYLCPIDELKKIYNGCGPDWLPDEIREGLTEYLWFFEAPFLEHDFSFELSDKTRDGFKEANRRLYNNSCKLVANYYSWWISPITKARRYAQAFAIYRACARFGWSAWLDETPNNKKEA